MFFAQIYYRYVINVIIIFHFYASTRTILQCTLYPGSRYVIILKSDILIAEKKKHYRTEKLRVYEEVIKIVLKEDLILLA